MVELRSHAGSLIAAAAITTSFFGSQALGRHGIGAAGWVAIGLFASLGLAVLLVLWPRRDWEFSLGPGEFITTYLEPPEGEPLELYLIERDLAMHMGRSTKSNRYQLNVLITIFRFGTLLLAAEVLAWVVALIVQR